MTDRDKIKLCAEAMKLGVYWGTPELNTCPLLPNGEMYDPRHDDEQAMALVKKFDLNIAGSKRVWLVGRNGIDSVEHADLNRAIVECVAIMQAASSG